MSGSFTFFSPVKVFVEYDPFEILPNFIADSRRIGIISGKKAIIKTGFKDLLLARFSDRDIYFFDEIGENPTINEVIKGGRFLRENKVEKVIAFGGGSALDAGKASAIFATNNLPFYDLLAEKNYDKPIPLLAIPTTCGTGSEVNNYSIITDLEKVDKINFNKPDTFPQSAILWSEYLKTLDEFLLLGTVYDAFSHALEGYISKRANRFSDTIALESMRLILSGLKRYSDTGEIDYKSFQYAATLAGIVILHTGTTLLHALGYYLTNVHNVQHGLANALLLPKYLNMCEGMDVEKLRIVRLLEKELGFSVADSISNIFGTKLREISCFVDCQKMVEYALGKPNTASTPFVVDKNYILKHLF
jgi:alcohol dehydrogenase class IV